MKKYTYLWIVLLMASVKLFAQGQNNNWLWSQGKHITFNTNPPIIFPIAGVLPSFGYTSAVISSSTGVLLFYTNGNVVKDAAHNTMPNGILNTMSPNYSTERQSALIVPDPGNSNRYFLFLTIEFGSPFNNTFTTELRYSIIDMSLNGGMGDVVSTSKNVFIANNVECQLTATKQTGTNNFWILVHSNNANAFNAYLLTSVGISSTPITSLIGPNPIITGFLGNYGCLKVNPQGTRIARLDPNANGSNAELYNFNSTTGIVSNYLLLNSGLTNPAHRSLEFSMNGNILYHCLVNKVVQYDLNNNNAITYMTHYGTSCSMQLAPNGKIYLENDTATTFVMSSAISVIDQPDIPGAGCNYIYGAQPVGNFSNSNYSPCTNCAFPNFVPCLMLGNFNNYLPSIDSQYANNVSYTTATLHARVSWSGSSPISQRGFYYSTAPFPSINQTFVPGTTGPYLANLSGLTPNTLYYYRAFATNSNGTNVYYDSTFHTLDPNTAPVIKYIHNKATCITDTMHFVVVDSETTPAHVNLSITSSNPSLLPVANISITGSDTNKLITFTPIPYQSGNSIITITAIDSNGASTSQSFTVNVAAGSPIAISAPYGTYACNGGSILITCVIPSGTTINWFINSVPSGNSSSQISATQSASYNVVCTNNLGCATLSNTIVATVNAVPQAQCNVNGPNTICIGDSVQLQAISISGYSYQWFMNSQLIPNATSASYYAKLSGNYSYVATLNGCNKTSNIQTIQVLPAPVISITSTLPTSVCDGNSVVCSCAIPANCSIEWQSNGVPTGNASNSYTVNQSANITAVCTSSNGCTSSSNAINVTVRPLPQVQCSVNGPTTICIGDSVQVQALSAAGYSYQWFKYTQLLPNATNAIYYAKQSGDYSYVATLNGCSKTSNIQSIQVVPAPIASISTPNTTVICNGQGAMLQATTGAGYTYQWTMNGFDIAGATNPTYTATIGSYYIVKVSNGYCARTSSPITITVNTAPVAIIHWNGTQLFSPISFYSYQWYFNGVLIPGATGQYYTPTQVGLYYVMVGNENGCKSLSPNYNLLTLSINSLNTPSLSIYPNPTTGMLQVAEFKEGTLYVYNAMGQLIIKQTEPLIDLSKQANGIYQIRAYNTVQELIGIGRVVKE
jgi:hypothetical protein